MAGALTRAQILGSQDLRTERVDISEWGGHVFVRTMTGTERDAFEAGLLQRRNGGSLERSLENYRARLLTYVVVDDLGAPIFAREDDAKALGEKSIAALERLFNVATRLNAITEQDVRALTENLASGRSGSSTSGSLTS
jgi:hypothetical protein